MILNDNGLIDCYRSGKEANAHVDTFYIKNIKEKWILVKGFYREKVYCLHRNNNQNGVKFIKATLSTKITRYHIFKVLKENEL